MKNIVQKLILFGIMSTMTAGMLAGCGEKKQAEEVKSQEQQNEETADKTEEQRPELIGAEHPKFISDGIRRLVVNQNGKEIFNLSKEPADYKMDFDYWEILNPYDEIATVNTEAMYSLFDTLTQIDLSAPVSVGEGVDTGIAGSGDTMLVDFVETEDAEKAKSIKYADHTATLLLGGEDGEGNRYAAVEGQEDQVYKIPSGLLDIVYTLNPFDYILKIPALVNIDTVESVEITADGKTHTLKPDGGTYEMDKKEVEKEEFTTLYQALLNVMLDSEAEESSLPKGEREELLSVVFNRNTKNAPEIEMKYYTYDDTYDSISINGKERFLVKAEDVKALAEQIKKAF